MLRIEKAAVLGAGTMGAQIAAHLANAGIPTLLLDIAPRELTPDEEAKGVRLDSREVRGRVARAASASKSTRPPASGSSTRASARAASPAGMPRASRTAHTCAS